MPKQNPDQLEAARTRATEAFAEYFDILTRRAIKGALAGERMGQRTADEITAALSGVSRVQWMDGEFLKGRMSPVLQAPRKKRIPPQNMARAIVGVEAMGPALIKPDDVLYPVFILADTVLEHAGVTYDFSRRTSPDKHNMRVFCLNTLLVCRDAPHLSLVTRMEACGVDALGYKHPRAHAELQFKPLASEAPFIDQNLKAIDPGAVFVDMR